MKDELALHWYRGLLQNDVTHLKDELILHWCGWSNIENITFHSFYSREGVRDAIPLVSDIFLRGLLSPPSLHHNHLIVHPPLPLTTITHTEIVLFNP